MASFWFRSQITLVLALLCSCSSDAANCASFEGQWYVANGKGGPGVFALSQEECNVTVTNGGPQTHYVAAGDKLDCRPTDIRLDGSSTLCMMYDEHGRPEYPYNPAHFAFHKSDEPGETSMTSTDGDTWKKQWTPECPMPSTTCSKQWGGYWLDKILNKNYTVTQDGCKVSRKGWEFTFEVEVNYTACGDAIVPDKHRDIEVSMLILADRQSAICPPPCTLVWVRRAPDPPKPPLPSCLPIGACPIAFVDGLKPPCCEHKSVLLAPVSSHCPKFGASGYLTSGQQYAKCYGLYDMCDENHDGCCPGTHCVSQGISGWRCFDDIGANGSAMLI